MAFLTPQDRSLLLESLRPPEGYQLDTAIGTTYSLDLVALMVAPVGFTLFDVDPNDSTFAQRDPLEILEAIRRHAEQIVLFYEVGRIAVPRRFRLLLTHLEDRIVGVTAPRKNRSFHPKMWVIRYKNDTQDVRYRLLCLSRNLTFDRCWDTMLVLDGTLRADRQVGFTPNAPLRKFIAALPIMAERQVSKSIRGQVALIENEISRVEWDLKGLQPFNEVTFWPLGHDGTSSWPFRGELDRVVVVSPFLSEKTLAKLTRDSVQNVLVSRRDELDKTSENARGFFAETFQMADNALPEGTDPESLPGSEPPLQGLHAKLYVANAGRYGRTWTGSANATVPAFDGNVEFMVELTGGKSAVGVEAFLANTAGQASFRSLLHPYDPATKVQRNEALELLEEEIDLLRRPVAEAGWVVTLGTDESQLWTPVVSTKRQLPSWPDHISVACRPLSASESFRVLAPETPVEEAFSPLLFENLTSYLIIEISAKAGEIEARVRFLVNAELIGTPANRKERLLRHMLHDRKSVLRFLLLLLSDFSEDQLSPVDGDRNGRWRGSSWVQEEHEALLEPLLRALDRGPGRLTAIQSLLQELSKTEDGKLLIPEGLSELFAAVWQAKEATTK